MATKKRTGLGRGIGALIPAKPAGEGRPVDVFFPDTQASKHNDANEAPAAAADQASPAEKPARKPATKASTQASTQASPAPARKPRAAAKASTPKQPERPEQPTDVEEPAEIALEQERELVPVPGAHLTEVNPHRIAPNLRQPRTEFDEDKLEELTISVREFGVLQPIVVRPLPAGDPRIAEADYELIMGERRLRASKAAGLEAIPAVVRETADDDMLRDALLENIHRAELNPLEEASAYQQLLDDFGITQEELAGRIGRSRPQISNTLRLLRLPVEVQRKVAAGVLTAGHARAILSVGEPAAMVQLADKIVNEDLSVRAAEAAAQRHAPRTAPRSASRSEPGGITAYLEDVSERLGDQLNTRVKVSLRRTKGQMVIDFANVNDLNRILEELGVERPR